MTTYTTISNALVQVGAYPFATTMQALRDNPIAIAEADATVAVGLLPTVLLGTLTTTSGSTQTLSSLVLTPYKLLHITVRGVSASSAGSLRLDGLQISSSLSAAAEAWTGTIIVDLTNGVITSTLSENSSSPGSVYGRNGSYSTASTSISFTLSIGSFDAGTILVYGVK